MSNSNQDRYFGTTQHLVHNRKLENVIKKITAQAMNAWKNRKDSDGLVRIMIEIPSEAGRRFHFFNVLPSFSNNMNVLVVRNGGVQ
ncbi:hypothetical protein [Phocoenobacter skyensis]|uniref:hypothetical protein n=1 Tax=Phocoenobacter skyensis TaxID=97481 RepID=UPI00275BAF2C|nr:hypothetical protein [Pasteurella skyensis]MDP8185346.1 hypothetical protein [Pasteurella skyensis]